MQRALGASEPPGTPKMKPKASPNKVIAPANTQRKEIPQSDKPEKKDVLNATESKVKETSAQGSPQKKPPTTAEPQSKDEVAKGPENQKVIIPTPGQSTPQEGHKSDPQKPPDQAIQTGHKRIDTTSTTQGESRGFFGFGVPKHHPDSAKPAESLGGKMFGFGSSILTSASTIMNSAVQDEQNQHTTKTTPVSPKMPVTTATKSPSTQREEQKKLEQVQQPKSSPLLPTKVEKASSEHQKDAAASSVIPKAAQTTCPLCKVELNFGSKEPPNYRNCTECKNIVCNQCGFNPMPNVSEVRKTLILNCKKFALKVK